MQRDFDRPLNKRGQRDAPFMAVRLAQHAFRPDYIVSSPAVRALTTAQIFSKELGIAESAFVKEPKIYEASLPLLLEVIHAIPDSVISAAIFGHNPGLSHLAAHLCGEYFDMATCSIVHLAIPQESWAFAGQNSALLKDYDYPKRHLTA